MPLLRLMPWAVWGALLVFSVATYDTLPAEIPQHINASGAVTRSTEKSWFDWLLLPLIAAATQAMLTAVSALLPRRPDLFNFSEKERFLKIPAAFHAPVIARMRETLDIVGIAVMLMLLGVQVLLWRAAHGLRDVWAIPVLISSTILMLPLALLFTARVNSAVDEAERRWKTAER